jgi:hypothetical protein
MTQSTTIISGYLVELDTTGETTECFVDFNDRGTHYSASLAALDATGELEDRAGRPRRVPASTIERITSWAVERGY